MRIPTICLLLLAAAACGGDDDDNVVDASSSGHIDSSVPLADADPAAPDADTTPDAGPAGQPDAMICNTLGNVAPEITAVKRASAAPAANGGTIQDGTYHLVGEVFYGLPDGDLGPEQGTAVISGGGTTMQLVLSMNNGSDDVSTLTIDTGPGSAISIMQTCPNAIDSTWTSYNSAGGTLALHGPGFQSSTRVQSWQRQP